MKSNIVKSSILAGLLSIGFAFSGMKESSLTDITKVYTGMYECKSATLGEKDCLDDFAFINLELNPDNTFTLYYRQKIGKTQKQTGKYIYDKDKQRITFSLGALNEYKRECSIKGGELVITLPIGAKILNLHFEQK